MNEGVGQEDGRRELLATIAALDPEGEHRGRTLQQRIHAGMRGRSSLASRGCCLNAVLHSDWRASLIVVRVRVLRRIASILTMSEGLRIESAMAQRGDTPWLLVPAVF